MSNSALNKSVAGFLAKVLQLDSGTQKTVTAKMGFVINGTAMSQPQVLARLKQIEGVFSDIDDARNVLKQKVAARRAAIPAARLFVSAYETALKAQFGVQSPLLETFGISIQKLVRFGLKPRRPPRWTRWQLSPSVSPAVSRRGSNAAG